MNIYIYIYIPDFRYHISFFSPSTRFDKEDSDGTLEEEEGKRERKRDEVETRKRERESEMRQREEYTYIYIEGVVVLLVDFPFSYSI